MTESLQHKFAFKIEQKPEGGYVLHSDNPPLHIEGATKEEVEEKLKGEFMKLMPEGIAKKLLELSQIADVSVKTNVTLKNSTVAEHVPELPSTPMLSDAPKAEPLISPKLLMVLLLLLGLALLIWRAMPHR